MAVNMCFIRLKTKKKTIQTKNILKKVVKKFGGIKKWL
ncbi:hypothetical protein IMSAG025_01751 [Muribaculaceae bacterium]|jgi:hypothetical protein|nr:hypothetical protein IMSAG025_01751 [Muribaculaceae bacterium]